MMCPTHMAEGVVRWLKELHSSKWKVVSPDRDHADLHGYQNPDSSVAWIRNIACTPQHYIQILISATYQFARTTASSSFCSPRDPLLNNCSLSHASRTEYFVWRLWNTVWKALHASLRHRQISESVKVPQIKPH